MKPVFSQKSDRLVVNGKLEPDGLKLFLDVEKLTDDLVTRQDIVDLIANHVKMDLVDLDVINDIARCLNDPEAEETSQKDRRIAKGKPAETGADGKLLMMVKAFTGEVSINEEGEENAVINYRDIHLFDNIETGVVIARVYEPKMGEDGYDAMGKPLPGKKGVPYKLNIDKTLASRPGEASGGEFTEVVAQAEGYVLVDQGRLSIQNELVIKGNLDYHAGNLDFIGSVKILGDVMPEFRITARGNIEIRGMVRGKNVIISRNGDITVTGFLFGGEDSKIICAGTFTAAVMQEVNAEVGGNCIIKKECVDSVLNIGGALLMPDGTLMGGVAHVVKGVQGKGLGNEAGQPTTIKVCSSVEATMEYQQLISGIEDHDRAVELLKSHLGPLVAAPDRIQYLNEPLRSKMEKLVEKLRGLLKSREGLILRQRELQQKAAATELVMQVNYSKKLYPGLIIVVGKEQFVSKEEKDGPGAIVFDKASGEFIEAEYKEIAGGAEKAPK